MSSRTVITAIVLLSLAATFLVIGHAQSERVWALRNETILDLEKRVRALEEDLELARLRLRALQDEVYQTRTDLSLHIFPELVRDADGNTPDVVVERYLDAERQEDWSTTYECLAEVPLSFEEYTEDVKRSGMKIIDYKIGGYSLWDGEHAAVYVSLTVRYEGAETDTRIETEPWKVIKHQGQWKVRWLARQ